MNMLENIRGALGSLNSNRLRSALTMLGIVIGVASVVLMIAIGRGAQRGVTARIQSLGTNLINISPGSPTQTNVRTAGGGQGATTLPDDDVEAIRADVDGLLGIAPEVRARMQAITGSRNAATTVVGSTPAYLLVRNVAIAYGGFFTETNVRAMDKVAVLGPQILATLFPGDPNPIGRPLRIGTHIFTVIGVTQAKGQQGFLNFDDMILIPLSTMQKRVTGQTGVHAINVSVRDPADMPRIQETITSVLLRAHRIVDLEKQDFTVLNQADAVQTLNEVTTIFTLLLGGIAAISLLVGGIGVMNIMIVSVTERTREIGIRKAIGAKKRDILFQFLVESTILCLIGGMAGILLSTLGAWIVQASFPIDARVSLGSIALAFLFSAGVGIGFGLLPAYKAAALRPIQALRYE